MQVISTGRLIQYMQDEGISQARLARHAGCSRQFIHMLIAGVKTTCSETTATLIEEALRAEGALFVRHVSPVTKYGANQRATR
jgi:plasmid maintenance system antidote protein VapI